MNPFETVLEALTDDRVQADAIINIAEGSYSENGTLLLKNHKLRGAGSAETTLSVGAGNCEGIRVESGSTGTLIQGISLDVMNLDMKSDVSCQGDPNPRGIVALETKELVIKDVVVTGAENTEPDKALAGITLWITENSRLEDVTVNHTQRSGIELNGGHDIILRNITVHNAGQGPGIPGMKLQSGWGAFGFYSGPNSDELKGVILSGEFVVTGSEERNIITVHPKHKKYFQMSVENDFVLNAGESAAVYLQNFQDVKSSSGHLVEMSSGYAGFIEAIGGTHALLFTGPGDEGTSIGFYASKQKMAEYADTDVRTFLNAAVELDLTLTDSTEVTHASLAVHNVYVINGTNLTFSHVGPFADAYKGLGLMSGDVVYLE